MTFNKSSPDGDATPTPFLYAWLAQPFPLGKGFTASVCLRSRSRSRLVEKRHSFSARGSPNVKKATSLTGEEKNQARNPENYTLSG
jgi:hypothetical protein